MRIVFYNVNGSGVGHLMRGIAIARNIRKLAIERGLKADIFFLTTSEAGGLLFSEKFPVFKIPSRTVLEESAFSVQDFTLLAQEWTRQTLELLQPDMLVVDTFPAGYYDELPSVISLCRKKVIIYRPVQFVNLNRETFHRSLSLYDSIVIPETKETSSIDLPKQLVGRTKYFGPVLARGHGELLNRQLVRHKLNIADGNMVVYLTAGGGGDENAEKQIHNLYEALRELERVHFVVGGGFLYRGKRVFAPNVTWLVNENVLELMPGFDMAIAAAGYNTFYELMYAGVPSILIPQKKWADDQLARAEKALQKEAAIVFDEMPGKRILQNVVRRWRDDKVKEAVSLAAQSLVPHNYARDIAVYLLKKLSAR